VCEDLHPGNILVGETEDGRPKLHLLDCGLVVEMGPEQHVNLVKILGAFTRRNGRLAGQLMVDTSSGSQASPLDVELFVAGIEQIVSDDENNNFVEKVGDYIAGTFSVGVLNGAYRYVAPGSTAPNQ